MSEADPFTPEQRRTILDRSVEAARLGLVGRYASVKLAEAKSQGVITESFTQNYPDAVQAYVRQSTNLRVAAGAETALVFVGIDTGHVFAERINLRTGTPLVDSLAVVGYAPSDLPTRRADYGFEPSDLTFALEALEEQSNAGLVFGIPKTTQHQ